MARRRADDKIRLEVSFPGREMGGPYCKYVSARQTPKRNEAIYIGGRWIGNVSSFAHDIQEGKMILIVRIDEEEAIASCSFTDDHSDGAQELLQALLADGWQQAP